MLGRRSASAVSNGSVGAAFCVEQPVLGVGSALTDYRWHSSNVPSLLNVCRLAGEEAQWPSVAAVAACILASFLALATKMGHSDVKSWSSTWQDWEDSLVDLGKAAGFCSKAVGAWPMHSPPIQLA